MQEGASNSLGSSRTERARSPNPRLSWGPTHRNPNSDLKVISIVRVEPRSEPAPNADRTRHPVSRAAGAGSCLCVRQTEDAFKPPKRRGGRGRGGPRADPLGGGRRAVAAATMRAHKRGPPAPSTRAEGSAPGAPSRHPAPSNALGAIAACWPVRGGRAGLVTGVLVGSDLPSEAATVTA
eukprot:scaffold3941_cov412-Prasinococcus_capsulatus_cf.AAC.14